MLKIVNAKKTNNLFSAYYIPEDSEEKGYIEMTLDGDVIKKTLTSYEKGTAMYFIQARNEMRRCLKENIVPHGDEWYVMWY